MRSRILMCVSLLCACVATAAYGVAVPPAVYQPAPTAKESGAPHTADGRRCAAYSIALPAPAAVLKSRVKAAASAGKTSATQGNKGRPLQIGFARNLPDGERPLVPRRPCSGRRSPTAEKRRGLS